MTTDDGVYEIWTKMRKNKPSIQGTATFPQYWSVRTSKRVGGVVNTEAHFKAWVAAGLKMGRYSYMIVATEVTIFCYSLTPTPFGDMSLTRISLPGSRQQRHCRHQRGCASNTCLSFLLLYCSLHVCTYLGACTYVRVCYVFGLCTLLGYYYHDLSALDRIPNFDTSLNSPGEVLGALPWCGLATLYARDSGPSVAVH